VENQEKRRKKRATRYTGLSNRDHGGGRIRWIDAGGKRKSRNFKEYQEAVAELERLKGEARAVKDGRKPPQKKTLTLQEFTEKYWTPNRTAGKRSPKDDASILKKHLLPGRGEDSGRVARFENGPEVASRN